MTTGPRDEMAAGAAGGDRLRASHTDREQVIDTLKVAFVQDRLTKDEFDLRVGQAFTARTYAELAALTAGLPAGPTAAQPRSKPARAQAQYPAIIPVIIATTGLTAGLWADGFFTQAKGIFILVFIFTFAWLGILILVGVVTRESRKQNRFGGQPPPRSTPSERGQVSRRPTSAASAEQLPQVDHGQQETAEAARSDLPVGKLSGSWPTHRWRHSGRGYTIGYVGL